jgi:hypothetical protein
LPLGGKGIITEGQKALLTTFSALADSRHFYLTGGTALAEFYLGHRRSFDLDLFTAEDRLVLPFSRVLEQKLQGRFEFKVVRRFETFVEFEVVCTGEAIKVQLAYDSPFRFEEPLDSDLGVRINDFRDLSVDKCLAFYGRAEPRDAVDLFFILKAEAFEEISSLASQKDPGFDLYWFAIALENVKDYPDDIREWPVEMLTDVDAREIKELFLTLARKVMRDIRPAGKP